jgi:hypothetical protein
MSLQLAAQHLSHQGRFGDSTLVHMSPVEIAALQKLAEKHGMSLTINPETGLPEAFSLKKLLPAIIGMGLNFFAPGIGSAIGSALGTSAAVGTGLAVGGFEALRTGDLGRGIAAGLGAYGGASLASGLMGSAGAEGVAGALGVPEAATGAGSQAAMLAEQTAGFGAEGLQKLAESAGYAQGASPSLSPSFMAGVKGLGTEAGRNAFMQGVGGAKGLFRTGYALASPMLADQDVQTTTKMPQNQGYLRPFTFDPYTQRLTALKPVSHQDAYGSAPGGKAGGLTAALAGGGAVALADGGFAGVQGSGGFPGGVSDTKFLHKTPDEEQYQKNLTETAERIARKAAIRKKMEELGATMFVGGTGYAPEGEFNVGAVGGGGGTPNPNQPDPNTPTPINQIIPAPPPPPPYVKPDPFDPGKVRIDRMPTIEQKRPEDVMSGMSLDAYNALMGKGSTATKQWETAPMRPYLPVIRKPDNAVKDDIVVGNPPTGGVDRVDNPFQPIETTPTYPIFNNDNNTTNVNTFEPIDTPPVNYIVDFAPTDISPDTPPVNYIRDFAPIGDFAPTDISPDIAENPYDFAPVGSDNLYTPTESDSRLTEKYVYTPSVTVNPYEDITQNPYINKDLYLDDYLGRDFGGGGYNPLEDSLMYSEMAGYADGGMTGGPVFINRNGNLITVGDIAQYTDPFSPPKTDPGPGMRWVWESSKGMWVAAPTSGGGAGSGSQFNDFVGAGGAGGVDGFSPTTSGIQGDPDSITNGVVAAMIGQQDAAPVESMGTAIGMATGNDSPGGTTGDGAVGDATAAAGVGTGEGGDNKKGGLIHRYAMGGLGSLGGYSDGGRLLRGPGDGVSDSIPATIANRRPARLADGEFVVPARIVSELGNGSTEAGARKLYAMMDRVQKARGKTTGKGRVAVNSRADKHLPA